MGIATEYLDYIESVREATENSYYLQVSYQCY
jgi:hypothetical protein